MKNKKKLIVIAPIFFIAGVCFLIDGLIEKKYLSVIAGLCNIGAGIIHIKW